MPAFASLMQRHPLVFLHLVTALAALLLGAVILLGRKGTRNHRAMGWMWVALMACTTLSSAFIRDDRLPNLHGYTPIHGFTLFVAVLLPVAVRHARCDRLVGHRKAMLGLYVGGCVIAGIFTLLPGRLLGSLLWGTRAASIAS